MDNQKAIVRYFEKVPVEFIEKDGELYVTAEAVGRALGYSEPRIAVMKIIERKSDEFEGLTGVTKLVTPGGMQDVTVLSRDAVNLVGFFSKQPMAKKFRKFVLSVLREINEKGFYASPNQGLPQVQELLKQVRGIVDKEYNDFQDKLEALTVQAEKVFTVCKESLELENGVNEEEANALEVIRRNFCANRRYSVRPDDLLTLSEAVNTLIKNSKNMQQAAEKAGVSLTYIFETSRFVYFSDEIKALLRQRVLDKSSIAVRLSRIKNANKQKKTVLRVLPMKHNEALKYLQKAKSKR